MKLWIIAALAIASTASADDTALRDVLGEAPTIVRGQMIDDAHFAVADVLRGDAAGTITVRQSANEEVPLQRDEDVILLLDARGADGAYPLHHPAGHYRVEDDSVIVNANGIDGAAVSAKDLRPRAPDERIAYEQFRALVGVNAAPAHAERATAFHSLAPPVRREPAPPPAPAPEETRTWPWIAAALAALAAIGYAVRRAR